jgi:hypothetical protein
LKLNEILKFIILCVFYQEKNFIKGMKYFRVGIFIMSKRKASNNKPSKTNNTHTSSHTNTSVPSTPLSTSRDVAYSDGTLHKGEFIIDVMFLFSYFNNYLY